MFKLLSPDLVELIHDEVLNPNELAGRARDKSLEGALSRVDNRLAYGMIEDTFALAAYYAEVIAQGHCFNDGNKRTSFRSMNVVLALNGTHISFETEDIADRIILLAQGKLDAEALAGWLRMLATNKP